MLNIAIEAARDAGKFLKYNIGRVRNIERKKGEERNLVSEIDRGAEEKIISSIKRHYPTHAILAEESGASESGAEYKWIIDPLDGTTNFLHGVPIFSVTIAIERKGEIFAGVVYDPNMDEMFTAEKGAGAFCNGKRLRVSRATELIHSLLVTGFPYEFGSDHDLIVQHFVDFLTAAQGVRRLGSAALDLSYVAAGRLDGFWEVSLNPWDMAAGALLVAEAGGRVTDYTGATLDIYQRRILATNGGIHEAMLSILAKTR
jgi:myo-inositol-1(or 4)-monophosphatase